MSERVVVIDDPSFDGHRAPRRHPECPERSAAARSGLSAIAGTDARAAREVTRDEITAVHGEAHWTLLDRSLDGRFGMIDADTYYAPGTREATLRAAGAAAELGVALMSGDHKRAFALPRPPGHHAERDRPMGFCLLNNVAFAAKAAQRAGAEKVAIVDWDVHHGNGTQDVFERDGDVLFFSLHQWPLYPGTGAPGEVGLDRGVGKNVNLALPPGSGPAEYAHAFRRVVLPMLEAFAPDVLLVSAGYDAHRSDPLASMMLDEPAYAAMTSALVELTEKLGHGRVGLVLEGGYDLGALEGSVAASARALTGARTELPHERASAAAIAAVEHTVHALSAHWPALRGGG